MRRIDIDLLRSIAIISVVISHTMAFPIGAIGVQLFFFVSGYLLAEFSKDFSRRSFLIYRAFRLFPLAFLMVVLFHFRFESITQLVQNVFLIQTLFPGYISYPGGWSISYEWLFSLLISTGVLTFSRNLRFLIILISVIAQVYLYLKASGFFGSLTSEKWFEPLLMLLANVSFFVFGVSLRKGDVSIGHRFSAFVLVASLVLILFTLASPYLLSVWFLFVCSLSSLLLSSQNYLDTKLNSPQKNLIHKIGKYTYGLFCGHFIVMIGLSNLIIDGLVFDQWLLFHLGVFGYLVNFGLVFSLAYFFASISYRYLEKPSMNFARSVLR